ncbi:MAG: hypothetical protein KDB21_13120, partial [Acidimicrobiales bacterium]|nr:hypothetical protein [Acidimicrobiales bacterium]
MIATLVAAEASYRLVERPWQQRRLVLAGSGRAALRGRLVAGATVAFAVLAAVVLVPAGGDTQLAASEAETLAQSGVTIVVPADTPPAAEPSATPAPAEPTLAVEAIDTALPTGTAPTGPVATAEPTAPPTPTPTPVPAEPARVLAIGDSVLLGSIAELDADIGSELIVDAEVGRHFLNAPEVIARHVAEGTMGDVVVIHLGNNSAINDDIFDDTMRAVGDVPVVVVNVAVPRRWESIVNDVIARAPERWPSLTVVDWYSAASGRWELFGPDGVHPSPEGRLLYAQLVSEGILAAFRGPTG